MRIAANKADGKALLAELRSRSGPSGRVIVVPARSSIEASLESFASHAHFPDYFGKNLDALLDCLRDLPNTTMAWTHTDALKKSDPLGYQSILTVLQQADADNSDFHVVVTP